MAQTNQIKWEEFKQSWAKNDKIEFRATQTTMREKQKDNKTAFLWQGKACSLRRGGLGETFVMEGYFNKTK